MQKFPTDLNHDWELLHNSQTTEQFWKFAHEVVDGLNKGLYQNWQAAHALLSVMDMPLAEDDEVGGLLALLPNLEWEGGRGWDEEVWRNALEIISKH